MVDYGAQWLHLAQKSKKWKVCLQKTGERGRNITNVIASNMTPVDTAATKDLMPLPHHADSSRWNVVVWPGDKRPWRRQGTITVRALTRADADRLEAAAAAAWDAAAARGPAALMVTGATGGKSRRINGIFVRVPAERAPGGAPVYKRRGRVQKKTIWLSLTCGNIWCIGSTKSKNTRRGKGGWARTLQAVADGTLPHEASRQGSWSKMTKSRKTGKLSYKVKGDITVVAAEVPPHKGNDAATAEVIALADALLEAAM